MSKARDIADSTKTLDVDGGTIKLDGNYPTGTNNVALGDAAFDSVTTGDQNVAIGASALTATTDGRNNTAVGEEALAASTSDNNNTAVGKQSMTATDGGTLNAAFGSDTMKANTTGDNNVAVGAESLFSNTTASSNTAVGYQAAYSNTTGATNTALGQWSLYDNTSGSNNVALGRDALQNNTTASENTAVGYQAGYSNTTSGGNTYVGKAAGYYTTGVSNTLIGQAAGSNITSGTKNTILGRYNGNQGGLDIRTSSNNIVLSDGDGNPRLHIDSNNRMVLDASYSHIIGDSNFALRNSLSHGISVDIVTNSSSDSGIMINTVTANGGGTQTPFLDFRHNTGKIGSVTSNTSSVSYNTSSDYRLKENVVELTGATDRLKQLNPSRFNFIADADTTVDGFLAHEVQAVVPEAITGTHNEVDADGNPVYQGIDQSKLVPLLVATIQELEARITALEAN